MRKVFSMAQSFENALILETFGSSVYHFLQTVASRQLILLVSDLTRPGADKGLKLCCWLNSTERKKFARPFESSDEEKWPIFLQPGLFLAVLSNPESFRGEWQVHSSSILSRRRSVDSTSSPPTLFDVCSFAAIVADL